MARRPKEKELSPERIERKLIAESSLDEFIALIQPKRWLGNIHREIINWWDRPGAKTHQGVLVPRDHMKSALIALRAVHRLTLNPSLRILYISSTSNLATKQLKFIKDILTSDVYRMYWPDMVHPDEAKREKWTEREISIDHPKRKDEYIREPSIFTAGLTSNIVGLHCDIAILDDVVVQGNAYTQEGRDKVKDQYSHLSSVEGTNALEWFVGTRYHPSDLYSDLMGMEIQEHDNNGHLIKSEPLFEVFRDGGVQVESIGDGTGEYIWPRQKQPDGKFYGFNQEVLSVKKAQYINKLHFRAQYYNDPHDVDTSLIGRDKFQYYDRNYLSFRNGRWFFKGNNLNVFAAVDFAYSLGKKSDFTAIVVIGVDGLRNYYVLDIDRFKTQSPSDYYDHIFKLYEKWGFRKLRAEVSVAQKVIVTDLKENYIRPNGLSLAVEEFRPTRWLGSKEERILATLEPKYANQQMWHYQGGNCQLLEEELIYANPVHDDIKDALASAVDFALAPINTYKMKRDNEQPFQFHAKFGGVS